MASLSDAEAARATHAERLRRLGAHAILVKQVVRKRKKTFAVVALFAEPPRPGLATELAIERRGKTIKVELVAKVSPVFRPD